MLFPFYLMLSLNSGSQWLQIDKVFDYVTRPHQLQITGNHLYILSNNEAVVVKFKIEDGGLLFDGNVAIKGSGPGEVLNPSFLSATKEALVITDDQGISFFKNRTEFDHRMKYFLRVSGLAVHNGKISVLGLKPRGEVAIESFQLDGRLLYSWEHNLIDLLGGSLSDLDKNSARQFNRGSLVSAGDSLIFIADLLGVALKFDRDGRVTEKRDLSSDFGPVGRMIASLNEENIKTGFTKKDGGLQIYMLGTASCVVDKSLFITFVPNAFPDLVQPNTPGFICVYDTETLTLKGKIDLPKEYRSVASISMKETQQGDYLAFAIMRDGDFDKKIVTARIPKP